MCEVIFFFTEKFPLPAIYPLFLHSTGEKTAFVFFILGFLHTLVRQKHKIKHYEGFDCLIRHIYKQILRSSLYPTFQ